MASPNIIWVHLDKLDFTKLSPLKKLDMVNEPDRVGDVLAQFKETKPFEWAKPIVISWLEGSVGACFL